MAQGQLKEAGNNRGIIYMCLASGRQNNYESSNQTQTARKMNKEKLERWTEDITSLA
jgi:hypothetical protein